MPVHGSPNKFKQRTAFGLWKEFECPVGTLFNNETCGCSTFKISEYMAKQHQGEEFFYTLPKSLVNTILLYRTI